MQRNDDFDSFYELVKKLRAECPWDKEQTHQTLRRCLLEETYEVLEAIDKDDSIELKKELGDLLLQVVFHSVLAEEAGSFTIQNVIRDEHNKLITRHPHIFEDVKADTADEVKRNWEKLKMNEGRKSVLEGVPDELPALFKAYRIQEKAAKVGFDWKDREPVIEKIREEIDELTEASVSGNSAEIEEELGDLLFSIVNLSRFFKVNPEDALRMTIRKFKRRFEFIEKEAMLQNKKLDEMTLEQMDELWNKSKLSGNS